MKPIFAIPLLFLLLGGTANAAPDITGLKHTEFTALKAAEAANFKLPANVRLVQTTNLKTPGVVSKRYQQTLGHAEVLGGQLTVLTNPKGETVAVIGKNYPGLMSTNDINININDKSAQAITAKIIGNTQLS